MPRLVRGAASQLVRAAYRFSARGQPEVRRGLYRSPRISQITQIGECPCVSTDAQPAKARRGSPWSAATVAAFGFFRGSQKSKSWDQSQHSKAPLAAALLPDDQQICVICEICG